MKGLFLDLGHYGSNINVILNAKKTHSFILFLSSPSVDPSMRGATPLDVATAIIRCNQELALALKEWHLERIVTLLASTVTGLSVSELLGQQRQDDFGGISAVSQDSFSMDEWQPNDGERYLHFLRQAVFINGECIIGILV